MKPGLQTQVGNPKKLRTSCELVGKLETSSPSGLRPLASSIEHAYVLGCTVRELNTLTTTLFLVVVITENETNLPLPLAFANRGASPLIRGSALRNPWDFAPRAQTPYRPIYSPLAVRARHERPGMGKSKVGSPN